MKICAKNDEERCFLSVLSEEKAGKDPKKIAEPNELGLGKAQFLYTHLEVIALKGPLDLGKCVGAFQPLRHKPRPILALPLLFDMFLINLERRFPCFSARFNA